MTPAAPNPILLSDIEAIRIMQDSLRVQLAERVIAARNAGHKWGDIGIAMNSSGPRALQIAKQGGLVIKRQVKVSL